MSRRGVIAGSVGVVVLASAALRGVLRRFEIKESSMSPTLESGDWIVARRRVGALERGDIVVFEDPTGTGMDLVKRAIGLSGERIGIENSRVTIDGAVLADRWANGVTAPDGEWEIPEDHIWVLGDNRPLSRSDSRIFGPLPIENVSWKVAARYWPTTRTGMLT
jgi:signal peptidase I